MLANCLKKIKPVFLARSKWSCETVWYTLWEQQLPSVSDTSEQVQYKNCMCSPWKPSKAMLPYPFPTAAFAAALQNAQTWITSYIQT